MFYELNLESFPLITQYYTVIRNTVWEITDKDNILIIIKDGQCQISCDGNSYDLKTGDIFFIPANHSYERRSVENSLCTMTYIHFSTQKPFEQTNAEKLNDKLKQIKDKLDLEILSGELNLSYPNTIYIRNQTTVKDFEKLLLFTYDINLFSGRRQILCNLQSSTALCNILLMMSQQTIEALSINPDLRKSNFIPAKLRKAIGYIARHYSEQIKLDELAEYCNISKQQLIRYFKTSMNTTPINYITDYRLARAKELLFNQPHLSIKEISEELGFDNQRYFSRVFTKHNHETPTQYRNRTAFFVDPNNV